MKKNSLRSYGSLALALALAALAGSSASACTIDGREGILPRNDLRIEVSALDTSAINEQTFNSIIDKVEGVYSPIVTAKGGKLNFDRRWKDGTVNAYADRKFGTWNVHAFGGLARFPGMTEDAFSLVMCHELGHHLGGAPKIKEFFFFTLWAADEGEADYFATLKCMRRVFGNDDFHADPAMPALVTERCQKSFNSPGEIQVCERSAMAGLTLAGVLHSITSGKSLRGVRSPATAAPQFDTPDRSQVRSTYHGHPAAQCRLDTYFSGALCEASLSTDMNDKDPTVGACSMEKGDAVGFRPVCWYKPASPKREELAGLTAEELR